MASRFSKQADIEAGVFFMLFGGLTALLSLRYPLGRFASMGPGMFPLVLGCILTAVGLMILIKGLANKGEEARPLPFGPAVLITISILAFALMVKPFGLIAAVPAQVVIGLWASEHFTWRRAAGLSIGLLLFCYLVFVYFLGIPVPLIAG